MANLINLLAVKPSGFWEGLIFGFNNVFTNYAVAIILLTVCIKLVMLPTDFLNRRSSAKMQEVQEKINPKLNEIKKRCQDPQVINQKTQELYAKEGFNPMGSCLTMLVVMVLSLVVFFTLFGSLNTMASYKIKDQYENLQRAYVQEYVINMDLQDEITNEQDFMQINITTEEMTAYITAVKDSGDQELINRAKDNVKQRYLQVKESFLWIKNVWIADSPTAKEIPDYATYCSLAGIQQTAEGKVEYDAVMGDLINNAGVNGYFILAILTGITAFLYQYLLTKKKKQKENFYTKNAGDNSAQSSGKAMLIIMPIIMVVFTLSYNSIFALYIIISQLVGIATAPLINWLLSLESKKKKTKK